MLRLGFACDWNSPREGTWSGTPLALYKALQAVSGIELVDLDVHLPTLVQNVFKLVYARRHGTQLRFVSMAPQSALRLSWVERRLHAMLRSTAPMDALLSISDIAITTPVPQYLYFDMCVPVFQGVLADPFLGPLEAVSYTPSMLRGRRAHQERAYRSARGLFAMSRWAAQEAIAAYGLDPHRVHVVGAGCNTERGEAGERLHERPYILFAGRDFERKAGPMVLHAYARVASQLDCDLLVAGPPAELVRGFGIEGVYALGAVDAATLSRYFAHARLFVMPSFFEAYGLVFAEALSQGVPVIARDACAMSEIISHGTNGLLIPAECRDPAILAQAILNAWNDEAMLARVRAQRDEMAAQYSWSRVAQDMLAIIRNDATANVG